jgi:hypothetical protein
MGILSGLDTISLATNQAYVEWNKKRKQSKLIVSLSGERGIRTPGNFRFNGFQDRRIRPLCHLSGAKVRFESKQQKKS